MRLIISMLAVIMILSSCKEKKREEQIPSAAAIPVKLVSIKADSGSRVVTVSGRMSTEQTANLSFKVGGVIDRITVKEGDHVKKGQLLAALKSNEITAQVQQAQLALEKANRDYERANNLYRDSVATLEQLQNAKTGRDVARQQLEQVLFNQQYANIHAPADGFIALKNASIGELAAPGMPVLIMNVSSSSSQWILTVGLSDTDWAAVTVGNEAFVKIDAFPTKTFKGTVTKKALAADPLSGSFRIEIRVDCESSVPAVGMFGTANITPSGSLVGYEIPYDALLEASGRKGYVFVSNDKKTVKRVEVHLGSINNNTVTITDGLKDYQYLVVSGSPYLNDSSTIDVAVDN